MKRLLWIVAFIQGVLAVRVFARMARTSGGERIEPVPPNSPIDARVAVIVPVLNEAERIGPCLRSVRDQSFSPAQIIVVDGGSNDGTPYLIQRAAFEDPRVRFVDAAPVPTDINGKAYGLAKGLDAVEPDIDSVLTIDADVRLQPAAVASLLAFAQRSQLRAFSVAATQRIERPGLAFLHPSMLTTLVYRFGIPGRATTRIQEVQANGQCFLIERRFLDELGGFAAVQTSICEDVTFARSIAAHGVPVGFYEGGDLVETEMYAGAADAWRNWPRSLPMQDRYSGRFANGGLLECLLVQAAPLWLLGATTMTGHARSIFAQLQAALVLGRLGVLAGTARAYPNRPWTYWLSPLADLPVTFEIMRRSRRRAHTWRGRPIVAGDRR